MFSAMLSGTLRVGMISVELIMCTFFSANAAPFSDVWSFPIEGTPYERP